MSGFQSISDLQKGNAQNGKSDAAGLHVASGAVEEAFAKKMHDVALKEKEVEAQRLAAKTGFPHIDLEKFPVSPEALRLLSREEAEKFKAASFYYAQDEFRIGAIDPTVEGLEDLQYQIAERTQAHGALYTISQRSFDRMLTLYDKMPVIKAVTKDISITPEALEKVQADVTDFRSLQELLKRATTTDIVTYVLGAALKLNTSDVHVEAEDKGIVVRFRLDGMLHEVAELPKETFKLLVSRVKLVSSLKININDKPQDGRFTIKLPDGDVDVRVSTMPTVYGESIVMRLLKQNREGLTLDSLGFAGPVFEKLKHEIERPNGMIITTGPTGSGKTTTLYAIMALLNKPGVKIITLEDPVEYRMEGINQSQIDKSKDYTFGKGLRSILRQDPDIAMVGEIRDLETADIAIQAALTGHLMLSTIHTNSAAGAIPRFLSMGVKPFLLAPALNAVIGQRLARRLNPEMKQEAKISAEDMVRVDEIIAGMPEAIRAEVEKMPKTFYTAPESDDKGNMGYKGRTGLYEILIMTPEIEQMILSGKVSEYEVEQEGIKNGMTTMVQDGVIKALRGETSLEEVFRVIE